MFHVLFSHAMRPLRALHPKMYALRLVNHAMHIIYVMNSRILVDPLRSDDLPNWVVCK